MKITRIAEFSEEEISALTAAGKIIGDLSKQLSVDFDELNDESTQLLKALAEVISTVIK